MSYFRAYRGNNIENDCIAILNWVYRNGSPHTYKSIAEGTGISITQVRRLILAFREPEYNFWALQSYARKYGFSIVYVGRRNEILFVDRRRYRDGTVFSER